MLLEMNAPRKRRRPRSARRRAFRPTSSCRRCDRWTTIRIAIPLGLLTLLVAGGLGLDSWRDYRARSRAIATTIGSDSKPRNVILVVLDTVRADRLGLYGYSRNTTPNLDGLARRGVVFDRAFSTAPWTAPSHASLFTGRWPHELSVGWNRPLDGASPTLAEFLRAQGYATAGFVANTTYCSYETGLARGFGVDVA